MNGGLGQYSSPPIIAIVGTSNTGKTTFLQKLIGEMKKRGYRVGTVKHTHHEIETDRPGKDTWLHTKAGAEAVVLASPGRLTMVKSMPADPALEQACELLQDMDIILVEGYKKAAIPKIEILRRGVAEKLLSGLEQLIAVVSDLPVESLPGYDTVASSNAFPVPVFNLEDAVETADFIEKKYLK